MSDIIKLLPDAVANQIAAGEVIQRPASVVKELAENAVDSGASEIKIVIVDSGRTLVQLIDNGCGMSETDARLAFERHATSKIRQADDLFNIRTFGFRGEALASIAAVAAVELKTKRAEDEVGTCIRISESKVESQEPIGCANGSIFSVKNLFYNVPARRKFLKSNNTEFKHILDEFHRIALAYPDVAFELTHNDNEIYNLPASNFKQRIVNIFGKNSLQTLVTVNTKTSLIDINGYIGKPEFAKKTAGEQFFFVNKRYLKHPFFYRAVMNAYDKLLPGDCYPSFFLHFTVDPNNIDINIHPTKTEVKFTDEVAINHILQAAVKESIGKFSLSPPLDFDIEIPINIPKALGNDEINVPTIQVNTEFNPFDKNEKITFSSSIGSFQNRQSGKQNWETLYTQNQSGDNSEIAFQNSFKPTQAFFNFKNRFILTPVKSGLMMIDQRRAHERILFEKFNHALQNHVSITQKTLFPTTISLNSVDALLLKEILPELCLLGYDIREFGNNTFAINGTPADVEINNPIETIHEFIQAYKEKNSGIINDSKELVAMSLAKAFAIGYSKTLSTEEMQVIFDNLFACKNPNLTPTGKNIISIVTNDEIDRRFN